MILQTPTPSRQFARSLLRDRVAREHVSDLMEALERDALPWTSLPDGLSEAIADFESKHFAAGLAALLGGDRAKIQRRQERLVRKVVNAILFPLQAYDDRLLQLVDERGLPALFQHVVHEFVESTDDRDGLLASAEACRIAAYKIEELLIVGAADRRTGADLCDGRNTIVKRMWSGVRPGAVPHGWMGIGLLWSSALVDLGCLTNLDTTDHV